VTLKPGLRVTWDHRNRHGSIRHLWFPINVPLLLCAYFIPFPRLYTAISVENLNIFPPLLLDYFASPLKWFPLELGTGTSGQKTRMTGLPGRQRSLTISSAIWIECTNVTDRRTDRQTDTGPQQRPRLRIASRGKKHDTFLLPITSPNVGRSVLFFH